MNQPLVESPTEYCKFIAACVLHYCENSKKSTRNVLCIHTPVNDVKEQVSQGKYDSGVRVDHVAVAHYEAEVLSERVLAA